MVGFTTWRLFGFATGLMVALATGLTFGVATGLPAWLDDDDPIEVGDPRDLVRANLAFGLMVGLTFGFTITVAIGLAIGFTMAVPIGVTVGVAFGVVNASAGMRFAAFLLCVRTGPRALPWRLERFLHWATEAGLMRTAGTAYQFRHRELQDWLARNPTP